MPELIMPRLGETVTEGVIVKWLKKEGEKIKKEEPVAEISTDKVETDIPSPVDGVLSKIEAEEGQKIDVGQVIAQIEEGKTEEEKEEKAPKVVRPRVRVTSEQKGEKAYLSPLVRKIAKEKGIDVSKIKGTGAGGRLTKNDVLKHNEEVEIQAKPEHEPKIEGEIRSLTTIRKQEADSLMQSQKRTAHVTAIVEADFSEIDKIRNSYKEAFKKNKGFSLTYLPFVAKAAIKTLKKIPIFNSHTQEDKLIIDPHINLGIAVALSGSLIVPVIKRAEELSLVDLAQNMNDLAQRARNHKLQPDEVHGGSFTITNNGSYGSIIQTPIIVPAQVAILSFERVTKKVSVVGDAIAIRKKAFLPLTYDHRFVDGSQASTFLVHLKTIIEEVRLDLDLGELS